MTVDLDIDRCLTIAAYSAFMVLRRYLGKNPDTSPAQAVDIIRATNFDDACLDYIGGTAIYEHLNNICTLPDGQNHLRIVVREIVRIGQPWWLRLFPYGRDKVRSALALDQVQCLREAGLFDPVPDADAIAWWDELSSLMRGTVDTERMIRAREAERLSLEYERERLLSFGIDLEPEWVSLEDNTLGYDIRSYDMDGERIVSRLIEVKSTTSDAIFVTRNEWINATTAHPYYRFHVWKLPDRQFTEYSVETVRPDVPIDQGNGEWQDVRIMLAGGNTQIKSLS